MVEIGRVCGIMSPASTFQTSRSIYLGDLDTRHPGKNLHPDYKPSLLARECCMWIFKYGTVKTLFENTAKKTSASSLPSWAIDMYLRLKVRPLAGKDLSSSCWSNSGTRGYISWESLPMASEIDGAFQ